MEHVHGGKSSRFSGAFLSLPLSLFLSCVGVFVCARAQQAVECGRTRSEPERPHGFSEHPGGPAAMAHRLFEGREHAASYCRYRVAPPDQLIHKVLDFLGKRVSRGATVLEADSCRSLKPPSVPPAGPTLPAGCGCRLRLRPGDGAAGRALRLGGGDGRQSSPAGHG